MFSLTIEIIVNALPMLYQGKLLLFKGLINFWIRVYESHHGDNKLVGSTEGPYQVLPSEKHKQEIENRMTLLKGGHEITAFHHIYLCK